MSKAPLMPTATAVWLIDNSSLTFDQIANFCKIHRLEVRAIADGESALGIKGMDPFVAGQLNRDELEKAEKDPSYQLKLADSKIKIPPLKRRGPRYTPLSKRQDRPNSIYWLIRFHPELKDAQIIRLVGTTKNTIEAIRSGHHWNSASLTPIDPVALGLCTQVALDDEVNIAAKYIKQENVGNKEDATLIPAGNTQDIKLDSEYSSMLGKSKNKESGITEEDSVFGKFTSSD